VFNKFFDALQKNTSLKERSSSARSMRPVSKPDFITLIPVAMVMLHLTMTEAFFVEMGLVLFFLPYTMLFNWVYDYLRWTFVGRKQSAM
jgi:uncharacterized membrane protein